MAKGFSKEGKEPMQLYVNITNPMSLNEKTISKQQFKEYFLSASMALICSLSNLMLSSISLYIFKKIIFVLLNLQINTFFITTPFILRIFYQNNIIMFISSLTHLVTRDKINIDSR